MLHVWLHLNVWKHGFDRDGYEGSVVDDICSEVTYLPNEWVDALFVRILRTLSFGMCSRCLARDDVPLV